MGRKKKEKRGKRGERVDGEFFSQNATTNMLLDFIPLFKIFLNNERKLAGGGFYGLPMPLGIRC